MHFRFPIRHLTILRIADCAALLTTKWKGVRSNMTSIDGIGQVLMFTNKIVSRFFLHQCIEGKKDEIFILFLCNETIYARK